MVNCIVWLAKGVIKLSYIYCTGIFAYLAIANDNVSGPEPQFFYYPKCLISEAESCVKL